MKWRLYPLKLYISSLPVLLMTIPALIINIFCWIWLFIQIPYSAEQVFLHYNILFGVDAIGSSWEILYVPLAGSIIFIFNTIVGWVVFRYDRFMSYVLIAGSLVCQLFLIIAVMLLIFMNV